MSDKTPVRRSLRKQPVNQPVVTKERKPAKRRGSCESEPAYGLNTKGSEVDQDDHFAQGVRRSFRTTRSFSSTGGKDAKYAELERDVSERRFISAHPMSTRSKSTPRPTRTMLTTKSPSNSKTVDVIRPSDKSVKKTPVKKRADEPAVVKTPKPKAEIPVLTPEEQIKVDDEKHVKYPGGARVFSLWGKVYYSAVVADRDELGRYSVFYTEDGSNRILPATGIVPINLIRKGSEVAVLGEKDESGERVEFDGKVLAVPSIKNAKEWCRGEYTIELSNEENSKPKKRYVKWFDIFLTEAQFKRIIKNEKNFADLGQENIIEGEEGKRTRRSRVAVATPTIVASTPVSKSKSTPKAKVKISLKRKADSVEQFKEETPDEQKDQRITRSKSKGKQADKLEAEDEVKASKKTPQNKKKGTKKSGEVEDDIPEKPEAEEVEMTNKTPQMTTEDESKIEKEDLVAEENHIVEKTPEIVGNKKTPQSRKKKVETPKVDATANEDKTSVQENTDESKEAELAKEEEKEVEPRSIRSTRSTRSTKVAKADSDVDVTLKTSRQTRDRKKVEHPKETPQNRKKGTKKTAEDEAVDEVSEKAETEEAEITKKTPQNKKKGTKKSGEVEDDIPEKPEAEEVEMTNKTPQMTTEDESKIEKEDLVAEENHIVEKTPETVGNKKTPPSRKKKIETPKVDATADEDKTSVQENTDESKDAELAKEEEKEVEPRSIRSTRSTRSTKVAKADSDVDVTLKTSHQARGSKKDEEHPDSESLEKETVRFDLEQEQTNGHDTMEETEQVDKAEEVEMTNKTPQMTTEDESKIEKEDLVSEENHIVEKTPETTGLSDLEQEQTNGHDTAEETEQVEDNQLDEDDEAAVSTDPNMHFILTSANRLTLPSSFTEKDVKTIESSDGSADILGRSSDAIVDLDQNITDEQFLNSNRLIPFDLFNFCPVGRREFNREIRPGWVFKSRPSSTQEILAEMNRWATLDDALLAEMDKELTVGSNRNGPSNKPEVKDDDIEIVTPTKKPLI